jgi:hypothetical protein
MVEQAQPFRHQELGNDQHDRRDHHAK